MKDKFGGKIIWFCWKNFRCFVTSCKQEPRSILNMLFDYKPKQSEKNKKQYHVNSSLQRNHPVNNYWAVVFIRHLAGTADQKVITSSAF